MYAISDNYKTYINSSLSRTPKSKIVIDGVEYLDNVLMSTPLISHSNDTFIGGFPSKTCTFEIRDETGALDLNNKWIEVYRGLVINNAIEWVLMGTFKALTSDSVVTNKTKKTILFKGYDKRQLLDVVYSSTLDWNASHTGLEIVLEACSNGGLELANTNFNFANYTFTQKPNLPSDATNTEVISRMAEIGGEIAIITREGKVQIKGPTTTDVTISKGKRRSLSKENVFGPITTLVLGKDGYDDDIVYKSKQLFNKNGEAAYSNATSIEPISTGIRATANIVGTYLSSAFLIPIEKVLNQNVTLSGEIKPSGTNDGLMLLYWLNSNYEPSTYIVPTNTTANSTTYLIDSIPEGAEHLGLLFYSNYTSATAKAGDYVDYTNVILAIGDAAEPYEEFVSYDETEWRIENNPFVDLIRETIITDVAPFILNRSIIPFEMNDVIDDFYLDLNDTITIVDTDGSTFISTILGYETTSRINSTIEAPAQTETLSNYEIAGGVKAGMNKVLLEVNHATNQIKGLVTTTDDLQTKTSEIVQKSDEYTQTFYEEVVKPQVEDLSKALNEEIEQRSAAVRTSMDDEGNIVVHLGASTSPYTLETKNNGLYIYQNGELLQYLQGSFANIPNLKVEQTIEFAPLAIKKSASGRIRGVRAGDE